MTFNEFVENHKPIVSEFFKTGKYENTLVLPQDLFRIQSGLQMKVLWTMIDIIEFNESDEMPPVKREIRPGVEASAKHIVGYIMTEIPYTNGSEIVTGVPIQ